MPFGNRAALDAGRGGKYEVSQDCVLVLEGSRMGLEAVVVQEGGGVRSEAEPGPTTRLFGDTVGCYPNAASNGTPAGRLDAGRPLDSCTVSTASNATQGLFTASSGSETHGRPPRQALSGLVRTHGPLTGLARTAYSDLHARSIRADSRHRICLPSCCSGDPGSNRPCQDSGKANMELQAWKLAV